MIKNNRVKAILKRGGAVIGPQVWSRSPAIVELLGFCGFDFVYMETEHFGHNRETIEAMIRAAEVANVVPMVRLSGNDPGRIMQALDAGALGVIIPHIDDAESARSAVRAARYAPAGARGFALIQRAAGYGVTPKNEYLQRSNQEVMVAAMIESREAVENLEDILESGLDCVHPGRFDLSQSLGHPGDPEHPEVQEAIEYIIRTARKHGVPVGSAVSTWEEAKSRLDKGVQLITFSADMAALRMWAESVVSEWRTMKP